MLKKHAPLLFFVLSVFSIKLSSETFENVYNADPKVFELSGLKILTPKRELASITNPEEPLAEEPIVFIPKVSCLPLENIEQFKKDFILKNKGALTKILGPWYFEKPKDFKFEYSFYESMVDTALYSSGLYAAKRTLGSSDETDLNRYTSTNIFYKIYYKDRSNSDTLFYIYSFYKSIKVDASVFKYLGEYLKESSKHKSLSLEVSKEVLKLTTDAESLLGAFEILKDFRGLSSTVYTSVLKELDKDSQIKLAKEMIKTGADKNNVNAHLDWNPKTYSAAYNILKENDSDRPYLPLAELKTLKTDDNDSFMDKLSSVKTNCDLDEAWSVASSVIRELQ
jgi:hypothetical protein